MGGENPALNLKHHSVETQSQLCLVKEKCKYCFLLVRYYNDLSDGTMSVGMAIKITTVNVLIILCCFVYLYVWCSLVSISITQ